MIKGYCRARDNIKFIFKETRKNRNIRSKAFDPNKLPKYSPNFLLFSPKLKMGINMRKNPPFELFYDRMVCELSDGERIALDFHPRFKGHSPKSTNNKKGKLELNG
jgi:hypothetical protein